MEETWKQTLHDLEGELPPHAFNTWLRPLNYKTTESNHVLVEVPNSFYRDRLKADYASLIRSKLREHAQNENVEISFVISSPNEKASSLLQDISRIKKEISQQKVDAKAPEGLNNRYTFHSFVVGSSNQFAHAASLAAASNPGKTYNPLFLYGGVGLGKTHLLCAIGNEILTRRPSSRVIYQTSEQFTNELINAIRYQKNEAFRNKYRQSCDILLLDDIHFLGGKERTQEEFFHTFNTLHQNNRQIVLTSDQLPADIPDLDERLRSRFQWGLFCDIQPPEIETRVAILKKKAEGEGLSIPDQVAYFIASSIKSNVRVLEGALIRLAAFASLSRRELSLDLAEEVFGSFVSENPSISISGIQKRVAEFFNLNVSDLKSARRHKIVAQPRQIAMYLCRKLTSASFPEIGSRFGGKDHTTVMHGVKKIEQLLDQDPRLRKTIHAIEQSVVV